MKTTVIFDLDGTLLNTIEDLADGVNHALEEYGYPSRSIEEVTAFVGNGIMNLIDLSMPGGKNNPDFYEVFGEFKSYYSEHCMEKTRPYDGITELLKELSARRIKTAIVSNKNDAAVKRLADKYFSGYINLAVGERENVKRKPAPDVIFEVLNEVGSAVDECIYVGDSDVDIRTAQNAEMDCVIVDWGFRNRDFLVKNGANVIISEPKELIKFI